MLYLRGWTPALMPLMTMLSFIRYVIRWNLGISFAKKRDKGKKFRTGKKPDRLSCSSRIYASKWSCLVYSVVVPPETWAHHRFYKNWDKGEKAHSLTRHRLRFGHFSFVLLLSRLARYFDFFFRFAFAVTCTCSDFYFCFYRDLHVFWCLLFCFCRDLHGFGFTKLGVRALVLHACVIG